MLNFVTLRNGFMLSRIQIERPWGPAAGAHFRPSRNSRIRVATGHSTSESRNQLLPESCLAWAAAGGGSAFCSREFGLLIYAIK